MAESFTGAPVALVEDFKLTLGVVFSYGDSIMDSWVHLVVLGVSFIFFLSKKKNCRHPTLAAAILLKSTESRHPLHSACIFRL